MRIAITTEGVPSNKYPTLGIFAFDQAVALKQAGHEVVILAVDVRSFRRKRELGFNFFKKDGVTVYYYSFPLGVVPIRAIDFFKNYFFNYLIKKVINDYGSLDVVHAHFGLTSGYSTAKACVKRNIKYWVTEHGSNVHAENLSNYAIKKLKFTYENATTVFAVSNSLSNRINDILGIYPVLLPNMLNNVFIEKFNPAIHNAYNFICVAALIPEKRVYFLIEVFINTFKECEGVHLYICGEGIERRLIEKLVENNNMNGQIHLLGCVSRSCIADLLNSMDCFVLPSISETFGVAYLEALSMGVPVIATKCGGPEDFVTIDNGFLIPIDDNNALSDILLKMKSKTCDFDKNQIRESILEKYSQKKIIQTLLSFYSNNRLFSENI